MKTKEEYNDIYKKIKKHYDQIQYVSDRFDMPVDSYFANGINFDILANGLNITMNILDDNINSQGVDNSCRSILEALAILDLADNPNGYLDNDRKDLYRSSYAPIENHNDNAFFKAAKDNFNNLQFSFAADTITRQLNTAKCRKLINDIFGENVSDDDKCLYDPATYIKERYPQRSFRFRKFVEKHDAANEDLSTAYHFFSMMIHPWCESDDNYKNQIYKQREYYIDFVLDKVVNYIDTRLPNLAYDDVENYSTMFSHISGDNRQIMDNLNGMCQSMGYALNNQANIPSFIFEEIGLLVKDVYFYFCTRNYELEIIKFKSLIEMSSVLIHFVNIGADQNKRKSEVRGFILSSRARELGIDSKNLQQENPNLYREIYEIYNNFYCHDANYSNVPFDKFLHGMCTNWYYSLDRKKSGIKSFVSEQVKSFLNDDKSEKNFATDLLRVYDVSLDLEHACGYCYNATEDLLEFYSIMTLDFSISLLGYILKKCFQSNGTNEYFGFIGEMLSQCENAMDRFNEKMRKKMVIVKPITGEI